MTGEIRGRQKLTQATQDTGDQPVTWRLRGAIYASGFFFGNIYHMSSVVLPLWAVLTLDLSPLMIGIFLGSRQILPVLLSIHGGALVDRIGTRRVILVLGVVGALMFLLFPVFPWLWAAVALQMVGGLTESVNWIGAQALIGQVLKGNPTDVGRASFVMRLGGFIGPPLIGWMWDMFGPWGAFGAIAAWILCGWGAAWLLPDGVAQHHSTGRPTPRLRLRDAMPRLSDYVAAFRLLAIPAVALVIACTVLRQSGSAVQSSFYVIYLEGIGISGAAIGMLLGISAAVAAPAALTIGPLSRRFGTYRLLLIMVAVSIVAMAITPLLGGYVMLLIAISVRGGAQGMNLPLMITITSTAVDLSEQGKSMALRITINRLASALVPIAMGAIAEVVGIVNSFYIVG
ncbi:MAG: MFS transporter, partial [Alphaproteobacteria bacterium]